MSLVLLIFIVLIIAFVLYKRSLKLVIISVILIMMIVGVFLHLLEIEDYYGRNNHVYFDGNENIHISNPITLAKQLTNALVARTDVPNPWQKEKAYPNSLHA